MPALLELAGITVRFGGVVAISGLDLRVDAESLVAVIGPNGAGKTTGFNVITGVCAAAVLTAAPELLRGFGEWRMVLYSLLIIATMLVRPQGLLGSRAYVREHLGDVTTKQLKPGHAKLSAYFNSDNGTGRIRGVWLQSNPAVRPIFEEWIAPLKDLGVVALGPRSVASTDHVSFDNIGIPAFQFMVDRLEYNSRTHHSNMDVYDRVQRDDMVQQATVIAVFAYNAAMREGRMPRK